MLYQQPRIRRQLCTTLLLLTILRSIAIMVVLVPIAGRRPAGSDQTAVVGAISYNTSPSTGGGGICGSGVSIIPVDGPDTSAGTHVFVAGYFGYKNINAPSGAGCNTDGEGLIFDSWACGKFTHQGVAEQNVWWHNGGPGFEVFPNCLSNGDQAQVYVFNNTSYGNAQDPMHAGAHPICFLTMSRRFRPTARPIVSSIISLYPLKRQAATLVRRPSIQCRFG